MTELIVALDKPQYNLQLLDTMYHRAGVRWFKIGEQTSSDAAWAVLINPRRYGCGCPEANVFVDFKLSGTRAAAQEAVRRWADLGVAAVSTNSDETTEGALRGAEGTPLKVWRVISLTEVSNNFYDNHLEKAFNAAQAGAHGIICPGRTGRLMMEGDLFKADIISSGVRRGSDAPNNHDRVTLAKDCVELGVTYAVVGQPIYRAEDPVAAALAYKEVMRCP